jgi:glutamyl-tRNA reductase
VGEKRKMAPHIHVFKNNLKKIEQNEIGYKEW